MNHVVCMRTIALVPHHAVPLLAPWDNMGLCDQYAALCWQRPMLAPWDTKGLWDLHAVVWFIYSGYRTVQSRAYMCLIRGCRMSHSWRM